MEPSDVSGAALGFFSLFPGTRTNFLFLLYSVFHHFYHFHWWLLLGGNASVPAEHHTRLWDRGTFCSPYATRLH